MELKHSFTVPVSLDRAWDVLLDVERVATCMPGASLDSVDGDDITGKIKVKVGPITQVYAGQAHFTERNREAHVVTLEASGKETRGSGTASATVRSELVPDGDQTQVTVLTNLNVTGKAAQFGRGVLSEVSGKLGRHRWVIERTLAWLTGYRRLTLRYERNASHFLAFLTLAATITCYKKLTT